MSHVFDHFRHFGVQRPGIGYRKVPNDTENTEGYRRIPKDTEGYRGIRKDTEGHRRIPKDAEGYRRVPKDAEGCRDGVRTCRPQARSSIHCRSFRSMPNQVSHAPDTQDGPKTRPRGVQERFQFFCSGSWGAEGGKKGVQEGLETGKVERRRRRRHDHVEKGRQRSKRPAQGRPKAPTRPSEL